MNKRIILLSCLVGLMPIVSRAQLFSGSDGFREVGEFALRTITNLMQTLFALISLYIIYTTYKYINSLRKGDPKSAEEYKKILIGSIIGLAVAFSLWGIIEIISNTLGWGSVGIPEFTAPVSN